MRTCFWPTACVAVLTLAPMAFAAGAPKGARENYKEHCTSCHGSDGKAQTRLGKKSGAKDLSDKQTLSKLSDEEVFKTIKFGRKNAKGEEKMESFGDELSDPEITELVTYVRGFAK